MCLSKVLKKTLVNWIVALSLILFLPITRAEEPSAELMTAAAVLTVADWAQTRYIARNPNDYRELNPILGSHPSVGKVNIYFSTVLLLGALGVSTGYINREFLYFYVGIEGSTVVRNYQVGVRFQF